MASVYLYAEILSNSGEEKCYIVEGKRKIACQLKLGVGGGEVDCWLLFQRGNLQKSVRDLQYKAHWKLRFIKHFCTSA